MRSQIFTERLKAFIFIIYSHFVPSKLHYQEGEILSVLHDDIFTFCPSVFHWELCMSLQYLLKPDPLE